MKKFIKRLVGIAGASFAGNALAQAVVSFAESAGRRKVMEALSDFSPQDILEIVDLSKVKQLANTAGNVAGRFTRSKADAIASAINEKKEGIEMKKIVKGVLIAIGICAAIAGAAFALYKYFTPDYEDEFDDDFDDAFDDDDEDLFEEKA